MGRWKSFLSSALLFAGCPSVSVIEELDQAAYEINLELCACPFFIGDDGSVEECNAVVEASRFSAAALECVESYDRTSSLDSYLRCESDARSEYLRCVRSASCDAAGFEACGVPTGCELPPDIVYDAWLAAVDDCVE